MKTEIRKPHVFRIHGEDEGVVAMLTKTEASAIQKRIDSLVKGTEDDPFYVYEMENGTYESIMDELEAYRLENADE